MDREKAIQVLKRCEAESHCNHYKQHYCCIGCGQREALNLAIEALQEPKPVCEDAISRQDAIEALDHIHIPTQAQREYAIEIFEKIPPVEPKRPNGEWVDRIFDGCLKKECDQCGEMIDAYIFRQNRYNFCPNCGADCRGEGND